MRFSPPTPVPRRHPDVVDADLGGDRLLLHRGTRRLHVLNPSAARVWDELDGVSLRSELVVRVADAVGADPVLIRDDVWSILDRFRAAGLAGHDLAEPRPVGPAGRKGRTGRRRPPAGCVRAPRSGSWTAGLTRVCLGTDDPELAAALDRALAPLRGGRPADHLVVVRQRDDGRHEITLDDEEPVVTGSRLAALNRVVALVNDLAAGEADGPALHAGAVRIGERAVVLAGASGRGKSTLTLALAAAGAAYLTDEVTLLGPSDGRPGGSVACRPFPRPISLKPGSFPLFADQLDGQWAQPDRSTPLSALEASWRSTVRLIDPRRVGEVADEPVPLACVVAPHWRPGAACRACRCAPLEAVEVLLGAAFESRDVVAGEVFRTLVRVAATTPVWRLTYGDLDEAVAAVGDLASQAARVEVVSASGGGLVGA
ncbi:MAG: PqqD family peptide modification chaperone [Actinomyces sp.]|nr:MAG: PqqD family peptide modification chaperone [Actinomyces sp.]